MVIWGNVPETIFWEDPEATKQYAVELLKSDPPGNRLVIGFTEMLLAGVVDDNTERIFKLGTEAIMGAIDDAGVYPI